MTICSSAWCRPTPQELCPFPLPAAGSKGRWRLKSASQSPQPDNTDWERGLCLLKVNLRHRPQRPTTMLKTGFGTFQMGKICVGRLPHLLALT